jgi:glycosyltransferase involved in cell wall biosynthesis
LTPPPVEAVIADPPVAPVVGYFGSMRWQKGFHRLPDLFTAALDIRADLRFVVQAYLHPDDPPNEAMLMAHARLGAMPQVTLIEETLETSRFAPPRWLRCAAVVLPYDQSVYRSGTSGIFTAAIASGRATLSTSNTWMTSEAARAGLTRAYAMPGDLAAAGELLCTLVKSGLRRFRPNEAEQSMDRQLLATGDRADLPRRIPSAPRAPPAK